MSVPFLLRRAPAILGLLLGLCAQAMADDAPRPGAAGDGGHLWLAAPAPKAADGWQLLHHDPIQKDEASPLPHGMLPPVALPDGSPAICSRGGVFYAAGRTPEGALQLTQWRVGAPSVEGMSMTRRQWSVLPPGVQVLAMAADRKGLWLAVNAVPADLLQPVDAAAQTRTAATEGLALALRMPPGVLPAPAEPAAEKTVAKPAPLSKERRLLLLRFDGGEARPWNIAFPPAAQAWLASDGEQVLFATDPRHLWRVTDKELASQGDPGPFTRLLFAGRTALLAEVSTDHELKDAAWRDTLRARWSVWNPEADPKRVPNGECALPMEPGAGHGVVEWGGHPALVRVAASFKPSQPAAFVAPVDLHGAVQPAFTVFEARDRQQAQMEVAMLQLAVAVTAISLMVWSWRQGGRRLPKLPRGLARAGLLRRAAAAGVDLALAAAPVTLLSGVPAAAIAREWPLIGEPTSLADMRLGFLVGGIFIAHTMLGEGLTGRSVGKVLTGIEVVGLDGQRAPAWRIVLRGLLKWLELLSPALSVLAVFSPFGQRLGDLAAGTVVVRREAQEKR